MEVKMANVSKIENTQSPKAAPKAKKPTIGHDGLKIEDRNEMYQLVLDYFKRAYNWDGNDVIVETVCKEDLMEAIGSCKSVAGAVIRVKEKVWSIVAKNDAARADMAQLADIEAVTEVEAEAPVAEAEPEVEILTPVKKGKGKSHKAKLAA